MEGGQGVWPLQRDASSGEQGEQMRDWQCCSPWRVQWLSCEDTRLPKKVSLLIGFLYFYRNSRASQEMYLDPCTNCFLAQLTTKKETTNLTVIPREPQGTNCGMNPSHEMTRVVQNTYGVRGDVVSPNPHRVHPTLHPPACCPAGGCTLLSCSCCAIGAKERRAHLAPAELAWPVLHTGNQK